MTLRRGAALLVLRRELEPSGATRRAFRFASLSRGWTLARPQRRRCLSTARAENGPLERAAELLYNVSGPGARTRRCVCVGCHGY
jgi:hypothetical protein